LLGIPVMVIGLVGWALPFVPGAPLFFIGLAMCVSWHPKGRLAVSKTKSALKSFATRLGLWPKKKTDLTEELFRPDHPPGQPPQIHP
jgi:hypothetical protein